MDQATQHGKDYDASWLVEVIDEILEEDSAPCSEVLCDTCGQPITKDRMLIIWNEDAVGITSLKLVHKIRCDDKKQKSSSGAAYGPDWKIGTEWLRFEQKTFKNHADKQKLFNGLRVMHAEANHE